jgi:flagella basal body P-ring formation protein FlgA
MTIQCLLLSIACSGIACSEIALGGCIPITGNRILGRDLAGADPRFSALPATLTVGYAPAPGTKRVFTPLELQRLAKANRIPAGDYGDICFELPMRHLTEEDATTAMRRSLPPEAVLKIVELESLDIPAGTLEFPIETLEPTPVANHGVQVWRGHVRYAETRLLAVSARVELTVKFMAVVAGKDLPADAPIDAGSLRVETMTGMLQREKLATRIEDVQGRLPKRALKVGSAIPIAVLVEAPAVRKGDSVTVEVQSGLAHLRFQAIADSPARDGEMVELRNPANGKTFKARLGPGAKGFVVITAGQQL